MNDIQTRRGSPKAMLVKPAPRIEINIRPATEDDFEFIDDLQKQHAKMLGFMHRKTLETYIARGEVLIAEEVSCHSREGGNPDERGSTAKALDARLRGHDGAKPVGYIIGRDRYFKREDVGVIYQLVVAPAPGIRRKLIGASLVKAMFERAAYGCKLFCCWCAQDLEANHFWEAIGFVPLAFRTGSRGRRRNSGGDGPRIHIFWQKRIREGDCETPYWFPSQTTGGAIREDRLAIPIPPSTHWSDAKPLLLPEIPGVERFVEDDSHPALLAGGEGGEGARRQRRRRTRKLSGPEKSASHKGGLWFASACPDAKSKDSKSAQPRVRKVYHPKYVAAARELCARYLEEVQAGRSLPEAQTAGKYDVCRALESTTRGTKPAEGIRLLDAA